MPPAWFRAANRLAALVAALLAAVLVAVASPAAEEAPALSDVREVFPSAESVGGWEGEPPAAPVLVAGRLAGWVLSTRAVVASVGYSGQPFDVLVGLDRDGVVTGARLREHSEPVFVVGVSAEDVTRFVRSFAGVHVGDVPRTRREERLDSIAGATVSSVMFGDAILRAARAVAVARGILEPERPAEAMLDLERFEPAGLGRGAAGRADRAPASAQRRHRACSGPARSLRARGAGASGARGHLRRSLRGAGDTGPDRAQPARRARLSAPAPAAGAGDEAILILARGLYSVKGTAHVRTGVFDGLQVEQGDRTFRLTAEHHVRIDALAADDAPELRELGWFVLPAESGFDPLRPWRLRLLVERPVEGGVAFLDFTLPMTAPEALLRRPEPTVAPGEGWLARLVAAAGEPDGPHIISPGLWQDVWHERRGRILLLALMLGVLTLALVVQDGLARRPRLYDAFRLAFLAVTLVWLGWQAGALLSVVNVLTFLHALLTGFSWKLFLMEPLIFILWSYVALTLLFWGRGGVLRLAVPVRRATGADQPRRQDPARPAARAALRPARAPVADQVRDLPGAARPVAAFGDRRHPRGRGRAVQDGDQFRLRPHLAVRRLRAGTGGPGPRDPALLLPLSVPAGCSAAIPARLGMVRWLKRRPQCGRECGICAVRCPAQAIHPTGQINLNECIYCLDCQVLYHDDHTCPPLIKRRKRREAFRAAERA